MKKIALILSLVLLMGCLAACGGNADATTPETTVPVDTTPVDTTPNYAVSDNPVSFFSLTLGEDYENIRSMTVFSNEDGTVHVDYVGEVKKVGDLDESIFHGITAVLAESGLAALNGQDAWGDGEANGSMYIEFADASVLACGFSGQIPQEYRDGFAKLDAFFAEITASIPEYVPQPMVNGEVEETLLAELNGIILGSGVQNADAYTISPVAKDEYFAYTLGLSTDAGVADAAQSAPMMMTSAYSLSIVKLEEGADQDAVAADFAANVDWRKWVCVMPSDALVAVKDNMVLCLIAEGETYTMTVSGIEAAGWTVVETLENPDM